MKRYQLYPTLLNEFHYYRTEKRLGENFLLCDKQKLLDKINRKPYEQSEAMLKGIAFEYCLQHSGVFSHRGFEFDEELVNRMRTFTDGGVWQTFVETTIDVDGHQVRLYGYCDVYKQYRSIDVKTGKQYQWPQYEDLYQQHVYLLGAHDAGAKLKEHLYLVTDFKDYYTEVYPFQRDRMINQLRIICRDFIFFLENNRDEITDQKIFCL